MKLTQEVKKEIRNYILRVFVFLLLNRPFVFDIFSKISASIVPHSNIDDDNISIIFVSACLISFFVLVLYLYLTIKLCGLFKKLDKLNFWMSLLIVIILEIVYSISISLNFNFNESVSFSYNYLGSVLLIVILFIVYKIFNLLSKYIPVPFGTIGYITSIECYKNLYNKYKKWNEKEKQW